MFVISFSSADRPLQVNGQKIIAPDFNSPGITVLPGGQVLVDVEWLTDAKGIPFTQSRNTI